MTDEVETGVLVEVELHGSQGPRNVVRDAGTGRPIVQTDARFVALVAMFIITVILGTR